MKIAIFIIFLTIFILGLSYLFQVPYIYTILGFSLCAFVGHIITLDDDIGGGWSNNGNSQEIWRRAKKELLLKGLIVVLLILTIMMYPSIKKFGV